jgi:transcription elongation factor GreA
MTQEGFEKMKEDLDYFLKTERPNNIKDIEEARAHGDLSENAEYHAAKERQSFIEGRIRELQSKISMANVIDPSKIKHNRVAFGATVTVYDLTADHEKVFKLVGPDEADIQVGKISISSPVGKGLIGREVGDTVTIQAPSKTVDYEIIEIRFE